MKYIIGAYATAPSIAIDSRAEESEYYSQLTSLIPNIAGFEIPFWGDDIHCYGAEFLFKYMKPEWDNVLTCIPGSVTNLVDNIHFGIASDDEEGRNLALDMHERANKTVRLINEYFGRNVISVVQLATAPSCPVEGVSSSINSLDKSLNEILSWDWMGAKIVIEHCDSANDKGDYVKGFMRLEDEIGVIEALSNKYNVGMTVNWGRSVIEGKNPVTADNHIRAVKSRNILSGLMFSGTSIHDANYGGWQDNHMPFAQSYNSIYYEEKSLLTKNNIMSAISEADVNSIDYVGIKLLSSPVELSNVERRVGINRDACIVLDRIIAEQISSEVYP